MPRTKKNHDPPSFQVGTRIARCCGKATERYPLDAIRVLPTDRPDRVLLQASDGHQAVCTFNPGKAGSAVMIPGEVLPTRRTTKPIVVEKTGDHWKTSDGRIAEDRHGSTPNGYPEVGQALPWIDKRPHAQTQKSADARRQKGTPPPVVAVGIDVRQLLKVADGLGTAKLTLMITVPTRVPGESPGESYVDKPIAVVPAVKDAPTQGVGVLMPIQPERGPTEYLRLRELVKRSEQATTDGHRRRSASTQPTPQAKPATAA